MSHERRINPLAPDGFIRRHLRRSGNEQGTSDGIEHTVYRSRGPSGPWMDRMEQKPYEISTPGRIITYAAVAQIITPATLVGSVLVGFDFPSTPVVAATEVTGLVAGAVASVFVNKKLARQVI